MELLPLLLLLQTFAELPTPLGLCSVDLLSMWAFTRLAIHYIILRGWALAILHNHVFSHAEWNPGDID
jgi:hypothetical protein